MSTNVIYISKVKRKRKFESIKEKINTPFALLMVGLFIISGFGIYANYYLLTHIQWLAGN